MTRFALDSIAATAALAAALFTGWCCWRARRKCRDSAPADGTRATCADLGALPLAAGVCAGVGVLLCGCRTLAAADRFHTPARAASELLGILLGTVIVALGPIGVARIREMMPSRTPQASDTGHPHLSAGWIAHRDMRVTFTLLFIAASIVAPLGIRFELLGLGAPARELGRWSLPVTVAWVIAAAAAVQLLVCIAAAAAVVVLAAASAAVFCVTLGAPEPVLNGLALVFMCAGIGAAAFHLPPARLSLSASATVFPGFLFAVLTMLARQKTSAALMLGLPLSIIVLLVVVFMVSFLGRTVSVAKPKDQP